MGVTRRGAAVRVARGLVLLVFAGACRNGERLRDAVEDAPLVGRELPALEVTDLGGQQVDLTSLRGRTVVLNLWATWCAPCREEMPELQQLQEKYDAEQLTVVGLSFDDIDPADVVEFLEANGITYTNLLADGVQILEALDLTPGIPHTLLIDRGGIVRGIWRGRFRPFQPNTAGLLDGIISGEL